jgi:hypothetical protein
LLPTTIELSSITNSEPVHSEAVEGTSISETWAGPTKTRRGGRWLLYTDQVGVKQLPALPISEGGAALFLSGSSLMAYYLKKKLLLAYYDVRVRHNKRKLLDGLGQFCYGI